MPAVILKCTCTHAGQDVMYGKGRRVHNSKDKTNNPTIYRCTVCSSERTENEPMIYSRASIPVKKAKFKKGK